MKSPLPFVYNCRRETRPGGWRPTASGPPLMLAASKFFLSRTICAYAALLAAVCVSFPAMAADTDFGADVKPFLLKHFASCHGLERQEGNLRVDDLAVDFASPAVAAHWTEIMDRINSGEMPPVEEPRPPIEISSQVTEWIATQLAEEETARQAALGEKVSFRRLSREEYRNTIRDLLGVTFDAADPAGLPEDPDWQGFERIGSVLTLSATHVEKYLAAAETVLNEALALGPQPTTETVTWSAAWLRTPGDVAADLEGAGCWIKPGRTSCRTTGLWMPAIWISRPVGNIAFA